MRLRTRLMKLTEAEDGVLQEAGVTADMCDCGALSAN